LFHDITEAEQARVVDEISRYLEGAGRPTRARPAPAVSR
jgi:hypothetical protein